LALALAEMALGGRLGLDIDLASQGLSPLSLLFAESNGRLVVEVSPEDADALESLLVDLPFARLGTVTSTSRLLIAIDGKTQIDLEVAVLVNAWLRQPIGVS
jgi:phosphoribosylformylglycinamidine synthase